MENPKPNKKTSRKRRCAAWAFALALLAVAAAAVYVLIVFLQMPPLDSMLRETRRPAIIFIDRDGYEIRSANKIMGAPVSAETLPPHVWQAIIAIEDKRFFNHGAVDLRGLARSLASNARAGRVVAGGSSLTQQTAKNIFLSGDRKISRKIQELILSFWLESRFEKRQILDLYMNRVSLVRGMRGIDAAANDLFHKTAKELSIAESAQIAAMLKAPTAYSPARNPDKNIARARVVLKEMARQKYITPAQARDAAAQLRPATPQPDTNVFRYWTDYVTEEIAAALGDDVSSDLLVYTTLDSDLQERIAEIVSDKIAAAAGKRATQAAAVAMSLDGALRAMVGGTDYQGSQFNRTLAPRQPGSLFKIAAYLVALENGMTPQDIVNDSPFAIGDYTPRNYNEKYYGDITLTTAFAKSANSVPLKLAEQFGLSEVIHMAARLGAGAKLRHEYSTVLGASEMTLVNMTAIYDVIWNGGNSVKPYAIEKIMSPDGRILYKRTPGGSMALMAPEVAADMSRMLRAAVSDTGTGRRAMAPGVRGGKTGTSSEYRDAWFVGATDDLTIGLWVGNDDFSPMDNVTGGTIPADMFKEIAQ